MLSAITFVSKIIGVDDITRAATLQAKISRISEDLSVQAIVETRKAVPFEPGEVEVLELALERLGDAPDAFMAQHVRFLIALSSRFNDGQHIFPSSFHEEALAVVMTIWQTKFSGPTKPRKSLTAVAAKAAMTNPGWLGDYIALQRKAGGFDRRDYLLPAPMGVSLSAGRCNQPTALKWMRRVLYRLGVGAERVRMLSLPSARVTGPNAAHSLGFPPEDRRLLGRWLGGDNAERMVAVYSRQQLDKVVRMWEQIIVSWKKRETPFEASALVPLVLFEDASRDETTEAAQSAGHDSIATESKRARVSVPFKRSAQLELVSCCIAATDAFSCKFVVNRQSMRVHIYDDDDTDKTRGCKWLFQGKPHVFLESSIAPEILQGSRCKVCLPVTLRTPASDELAQNAVPQNRPADIDADQDSLESLSESN